MFTQVIIRKRKTDGLADDQRETIIHRHYCVAGYKNALIAFNLQINEKTGKEIKFSHKSHIYILLQLYIYPCNTVPTNLSISLSMSLSLPHKQTQACCKLLKFFIVLK